MSAKTDEILESLKSLSLLEASELVKQIEEAFGVSAAASAGVGMAAPGAAGGGADAADRTTAVANSTSNTAANHTTTHHTQTHHTPGQQCPDPTAGDSLSPLSQAIGTVTVARATSSGGLFHFSGLAFTCVRSADRLFRVETRTDS